MNRKLSKKIKGKNAFLLFCYFLFLFGFSFCLSVSSFRLSRTNEKKLSVFLVFTNSFFFHCKTNGIPDHVNEPRFWENELQLPSYFNDLKFEKRKESDGDVFVTGATGFLGPFLVSEVRTISKKENKGGE